MIVELVSAFLCLVPLAGHGITLKLGCPASGAPRSSTCPAHEHHSGSSHAGIEDHPQLTGVSSSARGVTADTGAPRPERVHAWAESPARIQPTAPVAPGLRERGQRSAASWSCSVGAWIRRAEAARASRFTMSMAPRDPLSCARQRQIESSRKRMPMMKNPIGKPVCRVTSSPRAAHHARGS